MYISRLSIRNYRNFKNASLCLKKGVNTILGENGSGKTNLFQAIRLLIDESLPRGTKFFESDFNRTLKKWQGHWIIIQICFGELDSGEEAQALAMHKVGEMEMLDPTTGSYSIFFRPKYYIRKQLHEYSGKDERNSGGLSDILNTITLNDYEVIYKGRGNIDFSIDKNYCEYVGNFDDITFPDPDKEQTDVYGVRLHGLSIPSEVSCTFAKALRDVEADLRSYRDSPLLNLLRGKEKNIDVVKKEDIKGKIDSLNKELSQLSEVKKISSGISQSIRESVGETYAPGINIQSELPSDMDKLLQSLKLLVGDPDEPGYEGKISELSLGGANLIYLSLKLLEYERVKAQNRIANFLLIEEPEAHIHTHIQKTLFQRLERQNTQVIISTHSTHISSVSQISSMNVLNRSNKEAVVFSPANGLDSGQVVRIERYLDAVRTNMLFAKGILLVEGDAEQILIPEMFRKSFGITLDEIGVSLINIGSTGFKNVAVLFHDDRIRKFCSIITDLDSSILDLPENIEEDTPEQKACRNSQEHGVFRMQNLNDFCNGNKWLKVFNCKYTFEVDFILENNVFEIERTITKAYERRGDRDRILSRLKGTPVSVCGKEILRLANTFGKGWFALMVSENVNHLTNIPKPILEAIAFASPHISEATIGSIMNYRLRELSQLKLTSDTVDYGAVISEMDGLSIYGERLALYRGRVPADSLLTFIDLIQNS